MFSCWSYNRDDDVTIGDGDSQVVSVRVCAAEGDHGNSSHQGGENNGCI